MACNEWNAQWVARLYDELPEPERERIDRHLEGCPACRRRMERLEQARVAVGLAAPDVPTVNWAVRPASPAPARWRTVAAFAAGMGFAALCFGLGTLAVSPGETPQATLIVPAPDVEPLREAVGAFDARLARLERAATDVDPAGMETRLAELERRNVVDSAARSEPALTRGELRTALDALQQQLARERSRDLEYVVRTLTAQEMRTGSWIDQTSEALQVMALRQDRRFSER